MGSQGHQNLPFGCMDETQVLSPYHSLMRTDDPQEVHGIGLPSYINHPGRPGQPLLNAQEDEGLSDFFSQFEGESHSQYPPMPGHFPDNVQQQQHQPHPFQMPQTYVGHETYVRAEPDWQSPQMNGYQFGQPMNGVTPMHPPTSPYTNGHMASPVNQMFQMNQHGAPAYGMNPWHQSFPNHSVPGTRPDMQFGTDSDFSTQGYAAPNGPVDADLSILTYAMQPASASTTQPNSRAGSNPNTEPSSPVTTKKRKLNAFQQDALRMTSSRGSISNGVATRGSPPPNASARKRKSFVANDHPPALMTQPTAMEEDAEVGEEDAEYDEDAVDDSMQSPSAPAPWPSSKARPQHKPSLPPKAGKSRKKSQSASSAAKPSMRRASSSQTTTNRVPLTAEQKKANHTNSEQKRRDAAARAYAELYDLVPEIEGQGKQSTMKKLEIVVTRVKDLKTRLEELRHLAGLNPVTGEPLQIQGQYPINMNTWHPS